MDMKELNARVLSNGMTRSEYYDSLNRDFTQDPLDYNGYFIKKLNIPYGDQSDRQKYDVYMPMGRGKHPAVIWVHGGGWFMGDRSDFAMGLALPYVAHGYTVVSIGYRLANEAVYPDPVNDVCAALKQIVERADEYDIDPARIGIQSGSAGTTIAALAALRHPDILKSVILRCPILDFAKISDQYKAIGLKRERFTPPETDTSIEALFLGGSVLELPEMAADANPTNHLTKDCPNFLLIHGLVDVDTPYLQSIHFAEDIVKATGDESRVQLVLLPETGHDNGHYDDAETFELQLDFLKRTL